MEKLAKEVVVLNLPSTTWGLHIHPKYEFIAILHINISNTKLTTDKGLVLVEEKHGIKAKIFVNDFVTDLPNFLLDIRTVADLSILVNILHSKNVCINSAETDKYPKCLKLMDNTPDIIQEYCDICRDAYILEELPNIPKPDFYEDINLYQSHGEVGIADQINEQVSKLVPSEQVCSISNKEFNSEANPLLHRINIDEVLKSELDSGSKYKKANNSDNLIHSKDKQGLCNVCGKTFFPGYRIEEHMLTHSLERPFHCKICNKSFAKRYNLKMHEHSHSGERPYICSVCGKTYTTNSNLRTHMLSSHSEQKKYICEICKMTFIYPRYLKLHMRKHTGERPFICSICGKKFSKNIHLTVHIRTHTGEKPYCCPKCGKGFTTTGGLGYHKKVHHKTS